MVVAPVAIPDSDTTVELYLFDSGGQDIFREQLNTFVRIVDAARKTLAARSPRYSASSPRDSPVVRRISWGHPNTQYRWFLGTFRRLFSAFDARRRH